MEGFFIGTAISAVDADGGFVLPKLFLEALGSGAPDGHVFLALHEEGHCLVGYDSDLFAEQQRGIDWRAGMLMGGTRTAHDSWLRTTFTFVEQREIVDPDRLSIGPIMRERGHIGRSVLLVGAGRRFEIWDLANVVEHGPSDLRWVAEHHLHSVDKGRPAYEHAQADAAGTSVLPMRSPRAHVRTFSPVKSRAMVRHQIGH